MIRILLLTSCVGFLSSSCYVKMLVALLLALAFLWLFLLKRPYRSNLNNVFQSLTMVVPVVGLAYGLAGGWEKAETKAGTDNVHAAYDSVSLLVIHTLIIVPPIAMGLATVAGTCYMYKKTHSQVHVASAAALVIASTAGKKEAVSKKRPKKREPVYLRVEDIDDAINQERKAYDAAEHQDMHAALDALQKKLAKRKKKRLEDATSAPAPEEDFSSWSTWSSLSDVETSLTVTGAFNSFRGGGDKDDGGGGGGDDEHDESIEGHEIVKQLRDDHAKVVDDHAKVVAKLAKVVRENEELQARVKSQRRSKSKKSRRSSQQKKGFAKAFSSVDVDDSGTLDFDEFMHFCHSDDTEAVKVLFDLLDEDKSGTLDLAEVEHILSTNKGLALASKFSGLSELLKQRSKRKRRKKSSRKSNAAKSARKKRRGTVRLSANEGEVSSSATGRAQQRRASLTAAMGTAPPIARKGTVRKIKGPSTSRLHTAVKLHSWAARAKVMKKLKRHNKEEV